MNKPNVSKFLKSVQSSISKHSPEILTGMGVAGMITTTVLAVRATPKALELIKQEKEKEQVDKLAPIDVVKATWKCYIPAAVTGVVSTACLIGASRVSLSRNAALATAYKLSENALTEYKDKVVEVVGEKKERQVRDEISKDRVEKQPVTKSEVIITDRGNTLCYDHLSGRYFKSDIDHINRVVNDLNRRMLSDMYISLNDLYSELGMEHIGIGYDLGWNTDRGFIKVDFSSQLADDGTPCLVLDYTIPPRYGYSEFL